MLRSLLFSLVAVVGLSAAAPNADAYFPGTFGPSIGYGGGLGVGYRGFGITNFGGPGFGWGNSGGYGYGYGNVPTPPYFALHPPVYYSHSVARPYGISPFPISSYTPSQRVVYTTPTPEPQMVINPYVTTEEPVAEEALDAEEAPVAEETPVVEEAPAPIEDPADESASTTIKAEAADTAEDADQTEDAEAVQEPAKQKPAAAEPTDSNAAAASYWPTPLVVVNPFVNNNTVVPVSFTKIVTP